MPLFSKRSGGVSQADMDAVLAWERSALESAIASLPPDPPLGDGIYELLAVVNAREILAVVKRHPELASEKGVAAMSIVHASARMMGLQAYMPAIEDRLAWLRALRDTGTTAADLQIPGDE